MRNLIERYIKNMSKEDIINFANSKNINLNQEELDFLYEFIKKNYESILSNPRLLDINRYQNKFTKENFDKITKVFNEYYTKYGKYL